MHIPLHIEIKCSYAIIDLQIKLISQAKVLRQDSFRNGGKKQIGNDLLLRLLQCFNVSNPNRPFVCLFTWSMTASEAGFDLAFIITLFGVGGGGSS